MLFFYKFFTFSQPFSQHPNKFYYIKLQNIHLTQPKIKIKTLRKRKKEWDRREKEWQSEGQRDRSGKREIWVDGGQRRPNRMGLGVENELDLGWVEDEISFGWISLWWWQSTIAAPMSFQRRLWMQFRRCWGVISPVLGCNLNGATCGVISAMLQATRSRRCWGAKRSVQSGVGAGAGCDETGASGAISLLFFSLSSIFLGWKSFKGKIKPENELRVRQGILQSTRKMNSIWPNFL